SLSGIVSESGTADDGQPIDTAGAGDHVFVVEATDAAGNTTQVSHAYTVLSAAQAAETLATQADLVVSHKGTRKSLSAKLNRIVDSLERGKSNAARGQLGAFINKVEDQRGETIADADADALIAYVQLILDAM
ncbi:MAG: hypothetical protein ABFS23_10905, partial [Pseudomonadota bacterium]